MKAPSLIKGKRQVGKKIKLVGEVSEGIKSANDIKWKEIGADDFAATSPCKRYFLRAECMGKFWWWCVYHLSTTIDSSWYSDPVSTKEDAFKMAEEAYLLHLKKSDQLTA